MATKMGLYTFDQFKKRKTPVKGPFTIYVDDKNWKKLTKGIRPKKTKGLPSSHGIFLVPDPFGEGGSIIAQSPKVTLEPVRKLPDPKEIMKHVPPDFKNWRNFETRFKIYKNCRSIINLSNLQMHCWGYCRDYRLRRFYFCEFVWRRIGFNLYKVCDCPPGQIWKPM